jgi:hypothetical protein
MKEVVYGVQLYGCMEIFRKDPDDFLSDVRIWGMN